MESIQPGARLGHYRIVSRLGAGGMGEVFRAEDLRLERLVAIKMLPPALTRDRSAIERLEREARLSSSLNHHGIVTIYAIEEAEDLPYIVMELVEGETLRDRMRRGPLETSELVAIGGQVAEALAAAHRVGLIHRDLKPSNILLTRERRAKLADFGLAKRLPSATDPDATAALSLTATGMVVGTAAYMSPEQSRGQALDARSDIFSLGVVLYEAATGRLPFEGPTVLSILHEIALVEPPAPSRVRAGLAKGLDRVLLRAMAKDRERRYATAEELAAELRAVASEAPAPGEDVAPSSGRPPSGVPNNLPVAFTSFVGRRDEMEEIARLLGSTRLVTLTGAGGCGKSRLAAQVARNALEGYTDGAWLVELAALAEPALVPGRVAQVLAVREEAGRPLLETLQEAIASRTLLLILDNCEHLTAACAGVVSTLIRSCPNLRILATSREPLGVFGETVWRVPPLSVPKPEQARASRRELGRYESVRLFVERAAAALPTFALTDENAPVVGQICAQLDGIPLAIELASVRVKVLPPGQILARLEDRFRLLKTGGSGELAHHQTLRAAVDWSYDLLSQEERTLFDRLSLFAGGGTLEAVEAVCSGDGLQTEDVLDLLANLVDKSLVQPEEGAGGSARYRLLETLRAYGKERLEGTGAYEKGLERHVDYFLALAEQAEPELSRGEQSQWLERLEQEHDNLRQASESTVQLGRVEEALRLAGALWRFWRIHGHFGEGRLRLTAALSLGGAGDGGARRARMKALLGAGALARSQSDYERARGLLEEGVAIGRAAGERDPTAALLLELGNVAEDQGERAEARALYEECLEIRRATGDRRGMGLVLHNLGVLAQALGENEDAARLYEQSLLISRELKNERGEALSLNALGSVALDRDDFASAQRNHDEALAIHRRLGDRWGISYTLHELGRAATGLGQYEKAHALLAESLAISGSLGDRVGAVEALEHVAVLAAAEGKHEQALLLAGAAAAVRDELGAPLTPPDQANIELRLAVSRRALGDAEAGAAFQRGRLTKLERAILLATGEEIPSGQRAGTSGNH